MMEFKLFYSDRWPDAAKVLWVIFFILIMVAQSYGADEFEEFDDTTDGVNEESFETLPESRSSLPHEPEQYEVGGYDERDNEMGKEPRVSAMEIETFLLGRFDADMEEDLYSEKYVNFNMAAGISTRFPLSAHSRLTMEGTGEYGLFTDYQTETQYHWRLRDFTLHAEHSFWKVRIGHTVFDAETNELWSPLNFLSTPNLTNPFSHESLWSHQPSSFVHTQFSHENLEFGAAWFPFFEGSEFDLFGSPWALLRNPLFSIRFNLQNLPSEYDFLKDYEYLEELLRSRNPDVAPYRTSLTPEFQEPQNYFSNSEFLLLAGVAQQGLSIRLYYFNGWYDMPLLQTDKNVQDILDDHMIDAVEFLQIIEQRYRGWFTYKKRETWALKAIYDLLPLKVFFKAAYNLDYPYHHYNFKISSGDQMAVSAGIKDFIPLKDWTSDLSLMEFRILDEPDDPLVPALYHPLGCHLGAAFFNSKLFLEFRWLSTLDDGDYYMNPELGFSIFDNARLFIGYDRFEGDDETILGSWSNNDSVYFRIKLYPFQ